MRQWPLWLLALLLTACASGPPAPVLDRSSGARGSERIAAGAPEVHLVRRGDTLYSIAFRYNMDHRTLAAWNAIGPPYTIYPDQVLWLRPPQQQQRARTTSPQAPAAAANRPPVAGSSAPATGTADARRDAPPAAPARQQSRPAVQPQPERKAATAAERVAANLRWVWPVAGGRLNRGFVAGNTDRQGIDIAGMAGQPVVAAADGEVVYSGAGFVGYAGLIIIKHNDSLLSAYAHNRRRLVAEGDRVKAGQQIAELGQSPRGEDEVYVQIRRDGVPQDPMQYLPAR